jgi:chromosomal replication initiation ATPase DnaA
MSFEEKQDENEVHELESFIIILQKGVNKHGHKTLIRQIQAIDIQKNNMFFYEIFHHIINLTCLEYGIEPLDLYEKRKRGDVTIARKVAILVAKKHLKISDEQLSIQFDRSRQVVYNVFKEFIEMKENLIEDEKIFLKKYSNVDKKVNEYIKELKGK